jgi:hypothetical protein
MCSPIASQPLFWYNANMKILYVLLNLADLIISLSLWAYETNHFALAVGPRLFAVGKLAVMIFVLSISRLLSWLSVTLGRSYLAAFVLFSGAILFWNVAFILFAL